ncbi:Oxidoreductase [Klenkia terrae]|uniref:Gfo/Idh/MocA family protein n=1 Tax=Klenkia terrae TaxID=1052259 RepID=UPI00175208A3|nr:Gfo/Idh/MocA family oxidoreductase [Klenkia terrae]SSC25576.1 Oxidoreductase [Klenkia terrae]
MSGRTRWGIVGTGGISRATVGDLHLAEDLDLVAVASRHEQTAAAFAAAHEVPRWYGDVDALLAADDVDVVYLCTPIGTHADLARRALLAGKHVLVEKALASTADEARSLAALAAEQGRFLMEAMWMRFNPAVRRVLADVADGRIGEVRSVRASFGFPPPPGTAPWQPGGGGALLDMGVYPLTLAHLLFGVPTAVEATGEVRADGVDLTASVFLRYGDDRFAALLTSLRSVVGAGADIGGTDGAITLDAPFFATGSLSVLSASSRRPDRVELPLEGNGYVPMFRAVAEAVADGLLEHADRPLRDTIAVLDTIDLVRARLLAAAQV